MTKTVIAVVISTSLGDISLELDKEKAPGTVENFINLVESGYYDETISVSYTHLTLPTSSRV